MSGDREAEEHPLGTGVLEAGEGPRPSRQPAAPEPSGGVSGASVGRLVHFLPGCCGGADLA